MKERRPKKEKARAKIMIKISKAKITLSIEKLLVEGFDFLK